MTATPANASIRLLASVGDAEPAEIGTLTIPIHARPLPEGKPGLLLTLDRRRFRKDMKRALRAAARAL